MPVSEAIDWHFFWGTYFAFFWRPWAAVAGVAALAATRTSELLAIDAQAAWRCSPVPTIGKAQDIGDGIAAGLEGHAEGWLLSL